jgi:hypothetical protein
MREHSYGRVGFRALGAFTLLASVVTACSKDAESGGSPSDAGGKSGSPGSGSGGAPTSSSGGTANAGTGGVQNGMGGASVGGAGNGGASAGAGGAGTLPGDAGNAADARMAPGGRSLSTDRNAFFGKSRCADAKVQLCEDFESGTLDTTTWKVSGDTPVIDGIQAARGSKALHIVKNGNGQSYIRETKTFPEPGNTYYGRMFVYFNSLPADPDMTYAHWTIIGAVGTGVSGEIRVSGQLQNKVNHFGVGTDNRTDPNGTGDWTNSDNDPKGMPAAVPQKSWACIEWMHKGDTNETRFYWDAVEHPSLYTMPSTKHGGNAAQPYILPQFTSVWVGWQEYQTATAKFEMWIDEIAIDGARIGCVL